MSVCPILLIFFYQSCIQPLINDSSKIDHILYLPDQKRICPELEEQGYQKCEDSRSQNFPKTSRMFVSMNEIYINFFGLE